MRAGGGGVGRLRPHPFRTNGGFPPPRSGRENLEFAASGRYFESMRNIVVDPDVCNGRPTLQGTRISVQTVLEFLAAGDGIDDLLAEYPALSRDDVLACLAYSARLMKHRFSVGAVA